MNDERGKEIQACPSYIQRISSHLILKYGDSAALLSFCNSARNQGLHLDSLLLMRACSSLYLPDQLSFRASYKLIGPLSMLVVLLRHPQSGQCTRNISRSHYITEECHSFSAAQELFAPHIYLPDGSIIIDSDQRGSRP